MAGSHLLTTYARIKAERARDLKKKGQFQAAETELMEALEEQPDHPFLKVSLADLYQRQGKLKEARVLTESILSTDPECHRALYVLGRIFLDEGEPEEALPCFQKASRGDQSPYLVRQTVRALRELERYEEALDHLDTTPAGTGEDPFLMKERALILKRLKRKEEALLLYEKLHDLLPEDTFVRKELYNLKSMTRPKAEVIEELETVLRLPSRKDDPQLHGLLAQKLKEAGRIKESASAFHRAWHLSDDNPFFLKQAGFCHYRLGEREKALQALGQAFRKDPTDVRVKSTLEKLYTTSGDVTAYVALLEDILRDQPHQVKLMGTLKKFQKRLKGAGI